jgi:hypothetical protein
MRPRVGILSSTPSRRAIAASIKVVHVNILMVAKDAVLMLDLQCHLIKFVDIAEEASYRRVKVTASYCVDMQNM